MGKNNREGSELPTGLRSRLVRQKVPVVRTSELAGQPFPLLLLSLVGDEAAEGTAGGTNLRDDVTYTMELRVIAEDNPDQSSSWEDLVHWREIIRKQFHHQSQPFADVPEFVKCEVVLGAVIDRAQWMNSPLLVSLLTIRVTLREARGGE